MSLAPEWSSMKGPERGGVNNKKITRHKYLHQPQHEHMKGMESRVSGSLIQNLSSVVGPFF